MEKAVEIESGEGPICNLHQARPERSAIENPISWLTWNTDYGGLATLWTGSGEAEALGELFFDNLATLLSVTDLMLGFFLNVLIGGAANGPAPAPPRRFEAPRALEEAARSTQIRSAARARSPRLGLDATGAYSTAIVDRYTTLYYERCIPGVAVGLLFGNVYYGYMAGRLAHKEGRTDVTAQPYGINTTGAFITLGAINLTALFNQLYDSKNLDKIVAGPFVRAHVPSPAMYSLMTGVGFVYLAFDPIIKISAEPVLCIVPLLVVLAGFFGGVRYRIGSTGVTIPVALVAICLSVLIGWVGGCTHENSAIEMYNYGDSYATTWFGRSPSNAGTHSMFGDSWTKSTCTGTSKHDAKYAYRTYAGEIGAWGDGIFDLSYLKWDEMKYYFGIILSASAAGDDYPMVETMIVDGVGTCLGACFGSFFGTTVYIGHPIHKSLGARRGYSIINGVLYAGLLWSGLFATVYRVIPNCAAKALLVFVGLLMCRQAIEDNPPRYYPAIFFGLFACMANWAKLYIDPGVPWNSGANAYKHASPPDELDDFNFYLQNIKHKDLPPGGPDAWWNSPDAGNWGDVGMGIKMMGEGGGEWWTLFMTAIFCYCIDRDFARGAILCAIATGLQGLTGIPTIYNRSSASGKMGPEMRAGLIDPPIVDDHVERLPKN
ncbi:purine nucleobase transmembrane transporter [Aureococcus anophagefferens]|nr:purine nucleobase transmembrane transporter [Aureococcus anophagefferens]